MDDAPTYADLPLTLRPTGSSCFWTLFICTPILFIGAYVFDGGASWLPSIPILGFGAFLASYVLGQRLQLTSTHVAHIRHLCFRREWPLRDVRLTESTGGDLNTHAALVIVDRISDRVLHKVVTAPFKHADVVKLIHQAALPAA